MKARNLVLTVAAVAVLFLGVQTKVSASHSWGGYHWARSSNPVSLSIGDNVDSNWQAYFDVAIGEWNSSNVLSLTSVPGSTRTRQCKADTGEIEVCNDSYGFTGWLGVAGISVSGDHITSAYVKLNDSYYNGTSYDTPSWRALVVCQEIGHTFGLDHQDENFDNPNLGTCMDYTSNPDGPPANTSPNRHDYDELGIIYNHLDGGGGGGGTCHGRFCRGGVPANVDMSDPREWGRVVETDGQGRPILYMRDFGNDNKFFTHIYPVPDRPGNR
jgi:hypothetical protein